MSAKSEFGRGYATCLIQFTFHRARLGETVDSYAQMRTKYPDLFSDESAAEIWANGASDHLYELERPMKVPTGFPWSRAKRLGDRAVNIGHGYRESSKSDPAECYRLLDDAHDLLQDIAVSTLDEALAWDTTHGLTPDKGERSCSENLSRAAPAR